MLLKMYINGELVDTIPVYPSPDNKIHVDTFRRQLLRRHSMRLDAEDYVPVFALEGVPSRLNRGFTSLKESFEQFQNHNPLFPPNKKHKE